MGSVNFISLHDEIRTKDAAIKYLQDSDIIKKENLCVKCKIVTSTISSSDRDNYVYFKCKTCSSMVSIRKDTFLYNKVISPISPLHSIHIFSCFFNIVYYFVLQHIALKTFLLVLYLFTATPQLRIPQIIHEVSISTRSLSSHPHSSLAHTHSPIHPSISARRT